MSNFFFLFVIISIAIDATHICGYNLRRSESNMCGHTPSLLSSRLAGFAPTPHGCFASTSTQSVCYAAISLPSYQPSNCTWRWWSRRGFPLSRLGRGSMRREGRNLASRVLIIAPPTSESSSEMTPPFAEYIRQPPTDIRQIFKYDKYEGVTPESRTVSQSCRKSV